MNIVYIGIAIGLFFWIGSGVFALWYLLRVNKRSQPKMYDFPTPHGRDDV